MNQSNDLNDTLTLEARALISALNFRQHEAFNDGDLNLGERLNRILPKANRRFWRRLYKSREAQAAN